MDKKERVVGEIMFEIYCAMDKARKAQLVLSDMSTTYFGYQAENEDEANFILTDFECAKDRSEIVDRYLCETSQKLNDAYVRCENYISFLEKKDGAENEADTESKL